MNAYLKYKEETGDDFRSQMEFDDFHKRYVKRLEAKVERKYKILIDATSNYGCDPMKEEQVSTIDDLLALMRKEREPLIIMEPPSRSEGIDFTIEIYDGYRE